MFQRFKMETNGLKWKFASSDQNKKKMEVGKGVHNAHEEKELFIWW